MEDWEFLRRPSTPQKEIKPKTVCITVLFAGEEEEYNLLENDTFEKIYTDYESKLGMPIHLEHNSSPISRYAKIKLLLNKKTKHALKIVLSKDLPKKKEIVKYKIRYGKHDFIEIEKTTEITVNDLLKTAISKIPEYSKKQPPVLEFDGDTLEEDQLLEDHLKNGDLLDLL